MSNVHDMNSEFWRDIIESKHRTARRYARNNNPLYPLVKELLESLELIHKTGDGDWSEVYPIMERAKAIITEMER